MIKVTVIVAIYNVSDYLDKCIKSVIAQTYKNLEIILVNDGSTDDSLKVCQRYEKADDRIKIIDQENQGVSAARNMGLSESTGDYIMFVDGDDFLRRNTVEVLLEGIADNDISICSYTAFDDTDNYRKKCHFYSGDRDFSDSREDLFLQLINTSYGQVGKYYTGVGVPWGKLYKKSFLESNDLVFNKELIRMQDNIFNMSAFALTNKIRYIDQPLYMYRLNNIRNYKKLPCKPEYLLAVLRERNKIIRKFSLDNDRRIVDAFKEEVLMDSLKTVIYFARTEKYISFRKKVSGYLSKGVYKTYRGKCAYLSKRAFLINIYMNLGVNYLTYVIAKYVKF